MTVPTTHEILEKVDEILNGRQANYADPIINFRRIAVGWAEIFGVDVSRTQVAMAMDWLKICREIAVPQEDNPLDSVGYSACWARVAAYEKEQKAQASGGPVGAGMPYLVGEPGPETIKPAIDPEAHYVAYDKPVVDRWGPVPRPLLKEDVGQIVRVNHNG